MASVQVSEVGITFPKWLVAAVFGTLLVMTVTAGATIIQTSKSASDAQKAADGAVSINVDQQKKIDQLQSAFIELAAQRSDISSLQKQQDRMDAKLDRIIEAQSRNRR
jgi:hypothetical protein